MSSQFTLDGIEDVFREDVQRLLVALREGIAALRKDPSDAKASEKVRGTGHSLKGAAALVGLEALSRSGATLERMAEVGATMAPTEPEAAQDVFAAMERGLDVIARLLDAALAREAAPRQEELYRELSGGFPQKVQRYLDSPATGEDWARKTETVAAVPDAKPEAEGETGAEAGEVGVAATDDDEFADELAEVFALELQEQVASVPAEVALLGSRDTRAIASRRLNRIFHTIKGSAAMVGLSELSEHSRGLEIFFEDPEALETSAIEAAQADINAIFSIANQTAPSLAEAVAAGDVEKTPEERALEEELLEAFNVDATEGIERSEQLLLGLERDPTNRDMLQGLFRQFHTLKGAAAAVGLDQVSGQLHHGETLLESVVEGELSIDPGRLVDFLFRLTDSVVALINQKRGVQDPQRSVMSGVETAIAALTSPEVAPVAVEQRPAVPTTVGLEDQAARAAKAAAPITREGEAGVVRVQASRLDALLNQVGQLVVFRTRMDEKVQSFGELRDRLDYCRRRLMETVEGFQRRFEFTIGAPQSMSPAIVGTVGGGIPGHDGPAAEGVGDDFTDLEFDKYDDFNILARSVIELATDTGEVAGQLDEFIESLGEEVRQFSKITSGLQRQITNLRLVPIETVYRRLLRPIRDAARKEGKLVEIRFDGGDVQLDRGVIESLYTPMLHIVRNAVSHGIENPGAREVAGKPRNGSIRVSAAPRHNSVTISVSDDGAGIDYDAILTKAIRLKLVDPENPPPREQLLSVIFRPGFSTAEDVTDISGRGVGMDVVARQVGILNGSVLIDSDKGIGTTVRLALPITTSIDEVLILTAGSQAYALPVDFVERVVSVEMDHVEEYEDQLLLPVGDERMPVLFLAPLVGEAVPDATQVGVVLRGGERAVVLVADKVQSQQEVVIRPLSRLLEGHPFLSASTISGGGDVIFVLHVGRLFELAGLPVERWFEAPVSTEEEDESLHARAVLVVDDSISVRKLAARFLESEGLEVETAVDGVDALEKLAEGRFRVVVTDLEMPRMHGYDLVEAIKNNPRYAHLPVIVCTSRSSDKHRRKAQELGAEGYITKPFSKEEILAEILRVSDWLRNAAETTGTDAA